MKVIPPLPIRELRATMEIKGLSLRTVAKRAKVNYTQACGVLKGRIVHPEQLESLRRAINNAPLPREDVIA